jgi:exodeoxyribonuclease VII small subunit
VAPTERRERSESDDLAGLSYEAARDELSDIVSRLESGGLTLEESLSLWERGERLADHCQRWLDGARARVAAALEAAGSTAVTEATPPES